MGASQTGNWAIFYRKLEEPNIWYTMKLWWKDGVLVSAKTFDDVYKFNRFKEAFDFAKNLITEEPTPKYDAQVKRVCRLEEQGSTSRK
ncbi:MAG: hypothetical protein CM15mV3_2230 [Caudoviricetes sp.]|nr:MAG: hypothetical protein CM15mV3_2230 [Caudoviricetes sp.]